jgi:hypothetical protein
MNIPRKIQLTVHIVMMPVLFDIPNAIFLQNSLTCLILLFRICKLHSVLFFKTQSRFCPGNQSITMRPNRTYGMFLTVTSMTQLLMWKTSTNCFPSKQMSVMVTKSSHYLHPFERSKESWCTELNYLYSQSSQMKPVLRTEGMIMCC